MILPPVILPVPVITPLPKPKLPTLALPVTDNTPPVAKLPPVILPVVVIVLLPAAIVPMILPPVILPVPVITPLPKPKLPTLALPVTLNAPVVVKFPPDTLPVTLTLPPAKILPATPTPPATFSAPVVLLVDTVVGSMLNCCATLLNRITSPFAYGLVAKTISFVVPVPIVANTKLPPNPGTPDVNK